MVLFNQKRNRMKELKKNFYCGDEVDYDDKCLEQCDRCVDATGVDYGYIEEAAERFAVGIIEEDYKDGFIEGAKWQQEFNDTSQVTRVEVIQHSEPYNGRAYTNYNAKEVEIQLQDDGKTLKIFLK